MATFVRHGDYFVKQGRIFPTAEKPQALLNRAGAASRTNSSSGRPLARACAY